MLYLNYLSLQIQKKENLFFGIDLNENRKISMKL